MLDYLRIMLNARLAKMDERGASAVEYGLLIAGIAALIVAVVFLLRWRPEGHLQGHRQPSGVSGTSRCSTESTLDARRLRAIVSPQLSPPDPGDACAGPSAPVPPTSTSRTCPGAGHCSPPASTS